MRLHDGVLNSCFRGLDVRMLLLFALMDQPCTYRKLVQTGCGSLSWSHRRNELYYELNQK